MEDIIYLIEFIAACVVFIYMGVAFIWCVEKVKDNEKRRIKIKIKGR